MSENVIEHFDCDCHCMEDILRFSVWLPLDKDPEDRVIYMDNSIRQWRSGIFIGLWAGFKSIFNKDDRKDGWSLINKEFWRNWYPSSSWARFPLAFRYVMGKEEEGGIFGTTIVRNEDLDRLFLTLSHLTSEIEPCENFTAEIESRDYRCHFCIEDPNAEFSTWLTTQYQFKPHNTLKRIWIAIRYAFGYSQSCYGNSDEYEIDEVAAAKIKYVINEVININKKLEDKRDEERKASGS